MAVSPARTQPVSTRTGNKLYFTLFVWETSPYKYDNIILYLAYLAYQNATLNTEEIVDSDRLCICYIFDEIIVGLWKIILDFNFTQKLFHKAQTGLTFVFNQVFLQTQTNTGTVTVTTLITLPQQLGQGRQESRIILRKYLNLCAGGGGDGGGLTNQ